MVTKDILLSETGSGGDFRIISNDLVLGDVLYQQFYMAMFGGNIKASTKQTYLENEERFDYWGNSLVWATNKSKQFNSETERSIHEVVLNSSGRMKILQAVKEDLAYLENLLNFEVEVSLLAGNRVAILITFTEKTNQQNKSLQFVFDSSKNEVIIEQML
jgi:hypothetical protein